MVCRGLAWLGLAWLCFVFTCFLFTYAAKGVGAYVGHWLAQLGLACIGVAWF
jgi:hypothetical protein